jgi:hypothetical protein
MVSQECVAGEARSYANVVWGTAKGSLNVTDTGHTSANTSDSSKQ